MQPTAQAVGKETRTNQQAPKGAEEERGNAERIPPAIHKQPMVN
jgi:hypothetical protein